MAEQVGRAERAQKQAEIAKFAPHSHVNALIEVRAFGNWSAEDMFNKIFGQRRVIADFVRADNGAVTVDWVVLTAAMVVMVTGVFITINEGVLTNASAGIAENITEAGTR